MSRIGNKVIEVPAKVSISREERHVVVDGPKGKLEWDLPETIEMSQEDTTLTLTRPNDSRVSKSMHGTARAIVANMVKGVSDGFVKELEIQGVGFRAAVKGKDLDLNLGFSHPVLHPITESITVTVTDNTKIKVEGIDKQEVGQFAAEVRAYYPPEPYKGKGIRLVGEYVRRKAGKSVQK